MGPGAHGGLDVGKRRRIFPALLLFTAFFFFSLAVGVSLSGSLCALPHENSYLKVLCKEDLLDLPPLGAVLYSRSEATASSTASADAADAPVRVAQAPSPEGMILGAEDTPAASGDVSSGSVIRIISIDKPLPVLVATSGADSSATTSPQAPAYVTAETLKKQVNRMYDLIGDSARDNFRELGDEFSTAVLTLSGYLYDENGSSGEAGYLLQSTGNGVAWVATTTIGGAISLEDLSDVASMTQAAGDLLAWDGTAWSSLATSSLGLVAPGDVDTSAELATLISDETGTGAAVFSDAPVLSGNTTLESASTTRLSVSGNLFVSALADGCVEVVSSRLTSTGTNCGTGSGGITSLNGLTASSQSFATSTSGALTLAITSGAGVHTFTAGVAAGYAIPRSASSTNWNSFFDTPSSRITDGTGLSWSGNTLNVDDSYVLNTGDTIAGTLSFTGTSSNIALGSNYLSGDGEDEGIFVDGSGNVGVGTASPGGRFHIAETRTSASSAEYYTSRAILAYNPGSNVASTSYSSTQLAEAIKTGNNDAGGLAGFYAHAQNDGTGEMREINGASFYAENNKNANVGRILGSWTGTYSWIGTITDMSVAQLWGKVDGGAVGNLYGLELTEFGSAGGTVGSRYGIYLPSFTGTTTSGNDFAIYQGGQAQRNYFAGSVGVGTSTPSAKLDVYSATAEDALLVRANNGSTWTVDQYGELLNSSGPRIGFDGSDWAYSDYGDTYITSGFGLGSAYNIVLDPSGTGNTVIASGNLGIGTTTPGSKVDVWGNLRVGTSSVPTLLVNTAKGNASIGTTSSNYKLTVSGDGAVYGEGSDLLRVQASAANGSGYFHVNKYGNAYLNGIFLGYDNNISHSALSSINDDLYLTTNAEAGSNGDILLLPNGIGKVGIGTTTPVDMLSVEGSAGAGLPITINSRNTDSTGYGSIGAVNNNGAYGGISVYGSAFSVSGIRNAAQLGSQNDLYLSTNLDTGSGGTGDIYFTTGGYNISSTVRGVITDQGRFGIGTTTPNAKLTVAGDINIDSKTSGLLILGSRVFYASSTNYSTLGGIGAGSNLKSIGTTSTAFGYYALYTATSSDANTALGYFALKSNTTGKNNTAVGTQALSLNTTGSNNNAFGSNALLVNTTGSDNTVIGPSLYRNTTGSGNIAIGSNSLPFNTSGDHNIALGYQSLFSNATGDHAVALGGFALWGNTSATNTVALGYLAGAGAFATYTNQGGAYIGYQSGYNLQTGSDYNTLLGYQAGYDVTTGSHNIIIGDDTSTGNGITSGSNNIIIGQDLRYGLTTTGSNQLNIGNLLFGTSLSSGNTVSTGKIGIGTSSPSQTLTVAGSARITGALYDSSNSAGSTGYVLKSTGSGTAWVATSTLGFIGTTAIDTCAELAAIMTGETGTCGSLVLSASPTFTGTVSAAALTLSSTLTLSGNTASRALFLDSSSRATTTAASAALADTITDETGSGALVFGTSPTVSSLVISSGGVAVTGVSTFANSITIMSTGNNSMEIGRTDGSASTPFIDFHSGATAVDYDARIIASGGTGASGGGTLTVTAQSLVAGAVTAATLDTGQGANELYDMNQNVQTTDRVTFAHATTTSQTVTGLTSALVLTGASGIMAEYAGASCTNQFIRSLSALGAATCATVANTDLANSTVSYGGVALSLGGSDATPAFNLTDATALPIATGVSGLGTGVATFLATPSTANLAAAVTGETGSGALVFGTQPTFTTYIATPFIYDSNDNSYFLDPTSASVISSVQVGVAGTNLAASTMDVNFTGASTQYGIEFAPQSGGVTYYTYHLNGSGTFVGGIKLSAPTTLLYENVSDRRLKENIATTSMGLRTLLKIPVRDFDFIEDPSNRMQGFIAQELYEVYPQAVSATDNGTDPLTGSTTPWGLDYGKLTPLIVRAVQELDLSLKELLENGTTSASSTYAFLLEDTEHESVWGRLVALAQGFKDGVLEIAGIKADEGTFADRLCVGETCVTEDELKALLMNADVSPEETHGEEEDPEPIPDTAASSTATTTSEQATSTASIESDEAEESSDEDVVVPEESVPAEEDTAATSSEAQ